MLTPCKRLRHVVFVAAQQRKCHELVDIVVSGVTDSAPIAAPDPGAGPTCSRSPRDRQPPRPGPCPVPSRALVPGRRRWWHPCARGPGPGQR
ncbi:hypothetical protein G6F68_018331 [Rhizopus microsporus]|nr:hypothetical protein G6F68_018331 [Rhizopus microsporus]